MSNFIYQFRVDLIDSLPNIWRQIQVPENYSFWDLHVAIQDAMGWLDYHLHEFRISDSASKELIRIGMPDEMFSNNDTFLGWETPIKAHLKSIGNTANYAYDFGDGWEHLITLETIFPADSATNYPICIAGERACPPEDCGGIPRFEDLLETLKSRKVAEKKELNAWLKNHAKNYYPFLPEIFDPRSVVFDDLEIRWAKAFNP